MAPPNHKLGGTRVLIPPLEASRPHYHCYFALPHPPSSPHPRVIDSNHLTPQRQDSAMFRVASRWQEQRPITCEPIGQTRRFYQPSCRSQANCTRSHLSTKSTSVPRPPQSQELGGSIPRPPETPQALPPLLFLALPHLLVPSDSPRNRFSPRPSTIRVVGARIL